MQRIDKGTNLVPTTSESEVRVAPSEHDTIQTIVQVSLTFHITPIMLFMDEIVA
jgi:hypothetical protein